jgi:hypothetical protein
MPTVNPVSPGGASSSTSVIVSPARTPETTCGPAPATKQSGSNSTVSSTIAASPTVGSPPGAITKHGPRSRVTLNSGARTYTAPSRIAET